MTLRWSQGQGSNACHALPVNEGATKKLWSCAVGQRKSAQLACIRNTMSCNTHLLLCYTTSTTVDLSLRWSQGQGSSTCHALPVNEKNYPASCFHALPINAGAKSCLRARHYPNMLSTTAQGHGLHPIASRNAFLAVANRPSLTDCSISSSLSGKARSTSPHKQEYNDARRAQSSRPKSIVEISAADMSQGKCPRFCFWSGASIAKSLHDTLDQSTCMPVATLASKIFPAKLETMPLHWSWWC